MTTPTLPTIGTRVRIATWCLVCAGQEGEVIRTWPRRNGLQITVRVDGEHGPVSFEMDEVEPC